jgi:hypothetical protein
VDLVVRLPLVSADVAVVAAVADNMVVEAVAVAAPEFMHRVALLLVDLPMAVAAPEVQEEILDQVVVAVTMELQVEVMVAVAEVRVTQEVKGVLGEVLDAEVLELSVSCGQVILVDSHQLV